MVFFNHSIRLFHDEINTLRLTAYGAILATLTGTSIARETPQFERVPEELREEFRNAPIHIYRDSTGDFSIQYDEDNEKGVVLYRKYLTDEDYKALNDLNEPVKYLPVKEPEKPEETRSKTILDCATLYNANAPSSFHIYYEPATNTVHGNLCVPRDANSRSLNKYKQNIKFNVYSANYSNQKAHTVVIGWFKETAHGHGMYFGDTHLGTSCWNGDPAIYNTRIEAWSQWQGYTPYSEHWVSTGTNYAGTCNEPWLDYQPYHLVIDAFNVYNTQEQRDQQWVQYSVYKFDWNNYTWPQHGVTKLQHVTYADWISQGVSTHPSYNGIFDKTASGIFIGSTEMEGREGQPGPYPASDAWDIYGGFLAESWY